ncbi:hypothetical protein AWC25_14630 [Mycobacterium sherrisii]|nr:alpha/beta hydrolase [Mycobacterium sherrisii]ORW75440.1 hypothetical protein AWC25_14630 [Mycobacterium sherrisii]
MLAVIAKGQPTEAHPHPLVFVHGAFQGGWCWDEHILDFFAERGFRVLAPSLRGHGDSVTNKPLRLCSISDYVDDLASVVDTLTPRPILVGHSMGGFVVQKYLVSNTAPAAVLLASAPPRGHVRTLLRMLRRHPGRATKFSLTGRVSDLCGRSTRGARELFFGEDMPETAIAAAVDRMQPESTRALLVDMGPAALLRRARIGAPVLVVGGQDDVMYPPRDVVATAAYYRTEPSIISRIGHEMMLEPRWPVVAECILSWLIQRGL